MRLACIISLILLHILCTIPSQNLLPLNSMDNTERYREEDLSTVIRDQCINISNEKHYFYYLGFIVHRTVHLTSSCTYICAITGFSTIVPFISHALFQSHPNTMNVYSEFLRILSPCILLH